MSGHRRRALLVGTVLFAFGIVLAFDRTAAAILPVEWLVVLLGDRYLVAGLIGLLALIAGMVVLVRRAADGYDRATPPTTELAPTGTPPGAEIDAVLDDGLGVRDHLRGDPRRTVRDHLRRAATATVTHTDRCPRADARERVASGEWTDDQVAATFLSDHRAVLSPVQRLVDALPGMSRYRRRVRRTANAIVERSEGGPDR